MGMAGPPPDPPPNPPSSEHLHQPSSIPPSLIPSLSSDLFPAPDLNPFSVLDPDLAAASSFSGQLSSDHPPLFQASHRRSSSSSRSRGAAAVSSRSSSLAAARAPDLAAAGSSAGLLSSDHLLSCQQTSPSTRSSGLADVSSRASSLAAARAHNLTAAVSSAGLPSSDHLLSCQRTSSSSRSSSQVAILSRSELSSALPLSDQQRDLRPVLQQVAALAPSPQFSEAQLEPTVQLGATAPQLISASAGPRRSAAPSPPSAATTSPSGPASTAPPSAAAPQQQTYAQVARNSRGPGFVRTHARDVESFARLPRTGVNIICGTREGMPSFTFVNSDLPKIEELYANALVMKFHGGRPSLETSHKEIQSWGIEHPFSIGPLSSRAYLLRFQDNVDLLKVLTRPSTLLITFPYKVYRWHNLCHMKEDSCLAPVWISLPKLPLQCFVPEFLESVANKIGRFLCFDKATSTLARPSAARLCVEIDLRKVPPPFIWVGLFDGFKQQIIYERLPRFCNFCHVIGHVAEGCQKVSPIASLSHADHRVPSLHVRPTRPPQQSSSHPSKSQQVSNPVVHPTAALHQRASAATAPTESLLQVQPTTALQQRAPAATAPTDLLLQVQPTSAQLQQVPAATATPTPPPIDALLQAQQSAELLQRAPAAAAPSSSSPTSSAITVPVSGMIALPMAQPATPLKPLSSPIPKQQKGKQKRKSVSFALPPSQQQSNIQANSDFWAAANRQIAIIEQARLPSSTPSSSELPNGLLALASADPILSIQPHPVQVSPSNIESDSGSSIAADSPPSSPNASIQDAQDPSDNFQSISYGSEGEDPAESSHFSGHNSDDLMSKKPHRSKRNKRHPDQPLKVQLRVRKDPTSTSLC